MRAPARAADAEDDVARVAGRLGVMDVAAGGGDARLVGLEIEVEMRERVVLDRLAGLPQRLEFRQVRHRLGALVDEMAAHIGERALQLRIGKRVPGVRLEVLRGDVHPVPPGLTRRNPPVRRARAQRRAARPAR